MVLSNAKFGTGYKFGKDHVVMAKTGQKYRLFCDFNTSSERLLSKVSHN